MGFSSEAVASWTSVQWALPLIVALYITSTIFARDVLTIFLILSGADIFPLPPQPMKVSHLRAGSRVGSRWYISVFYSLLYIPYF